MAGTTIIKVGNTTYEVGNDLIKSGNSYAIFSGDTAIQYASANGFIVPPIEVIKAVYAQARKLKMPARNNNPTDTNAAAHTQDIFQANGLSGFPSGLVAGHKKEVVATNKPTRTRIYGGWNGSSTIQPDSTIHGSSYVDYSQGMRTCRVVDSEVPESTEPGSPVTGTNPASPATPTSGSQAPIAGPGGGGGCGGALGALVMVAGAGMALGGGLGISTALTGSLGSLAGTPVVGALTGALGSGLPAGIISGIGSALPGLTGVIPAGLTDVLGSGLLQNPLLAQAGSILGNTGLADLASTFAGDLGGLLDSVGGLTDLSGLASNFGNAFSIVTNGEGILGAVAEMAGGFDGIANGIFENFGDLATGGLSTLIGDLDVQGIIGDFSLGDFDLGGVIGDLTDGLDFELVDAIADFDLGTIVNNISGQLDLGTIGEAFTQLGDLGNLGDLINLGSPGSLVNQLLDNGLGEITNIIGGLDDFNINLNDVLDFDLQDTINTVLSDIGGGDIMNIVQSTLGINIEGLTSLADLTDLDKLIPTITDGLNLTLPDLGELGFDAIGDIAANLGLESFDLSGIADAVGLDFPVTLEGVLNQIDVDIPLDLASLASEINLELPSDLSGALDLFNVDIPTNLTEGLAQIGLPTDLNGLLQQANIPTDITGFVREIGLSVPGALTDLTSKFSSLGNTLAGIGDFSQVGSLGELGALMTKIEGFEDLDLLNAAERLLPLETENLLKDLYGGGSGELGAITLKDLIGSVAGYGFTEAFNAAAQAGQKVFDDGLAGDLLQQFTFLEKLANGDYTQITGGEEPIIEYVIPSSDHPQGITETFETIDEATQLFATEANRIIDNEIAPQLDPSTKLALGPDFIQAGQDLIEEKNRQAKFAMDLTAYTPNDKNVVISLAQNLPNYGINISEFGPADFFERLADKSSLAGQAAIGSMRQARNELRLGNSGAPTPPKFGGVQQKTYELDRTTIVVKGLGRNVYAEITVGTFDEYAEDLQNAVVKLRNELRLIRHGYVLPTTSAERARKEDQLIIFEQLLTNINNGSNSGTSGDRLQSQANFGQVSPQYNPIYDDSTQYSVLYDESTLADGSTVYT